MPTRTVRLTIADPRELATLGAGNDGWALRLDAARINGMKWAPVVAGSGVSDGDYGDVSVSGSGTVWTLDLNLATIDPPTGSVAFAQQQATGLRIENRTSDPGAPAEGEIWLRTDL